MKTDPGSDHGATFLVPLEFKDATIELKFKIISGGGFKFGLEDKGFKDAHAGHLVKVNITKTGIVVTDRLNAERLAKKIGKKRNKLKKEPANAKLESQYLEKIKPKTWYTIKVDCREEKMIVHLNNKLVIRIN